MRMAVPIDGSPPSHRAVDYALRLAALAGNEQVKIHLLNVQEDSPEMLDYFTRDAADIGERLTKVRRDAGFKLIQTPLAKLQEAGVGAEAAVLLGDAATVIASYVDNQRCDMVVMGTRGRGPVGGLMLGSVAAKVVHLVKVPVTLVK